VTEKEHAQQLQSPGKPDPKLSGFESEDADYDLRLAASTPNPKSASLEELFGLLYSKGYLNTLTVDTRLLSRFTPSSANTSLPSACVKYIETQKVTKAINYANAVAFSLPSSDDPSPAAEPSPSFKTPSETIFQTLLDTALPAWTTYSLNKTAALCLTSEINNT
jgi:hypothetical protein